MDEGRNPELFTRHQLERTFSDHVGIQKKVQAYKVFFNIVKGCIMYLYTYGFLQEFRAQLIRQLEPVFPEEIQAYVAHSDSVKREKR